MKFKVGDVLEPKNPVTRARRAGIVLRVVDVGERDGEMCYRVRWAELHAPAKTMFRWATASFAEGYYQVAHNGVQVMVDLA